MTQTTTHNTTRTLLLAVLLISATMMSGCIDDAEITTIADPIKDISQLTAAPEFHIMAVGETCRTDALTVIVSDMEIVSKYQYMGYRDVETIYPDFHNVFVIIDCTIENTGIKESVYGGAYSFSMEDQNAFRYEQSSALMRSDIDSLSSFTELYPNQKITGKIVFELPENSTTNTLYYDFGSIFGTNLAGWTVNL